MTSREIPVFVRLTVTPFQISSFLLYLLRRPSAFIILHLTFLHDNLDSPRSCKGACSHQYSTNAKLMRVSFSHIVQTGYHSFVDPEESLAVKVDGDGRMGL